MRLRHAVLGGCLSVMLVSWQASADEEALSPAEQAAIAAAQAASAVDQTQRRIKMCHHVLLSGMDDQKADLVAMLDGRTCAEAVEDELAAEAAASE